MRALLLIASGLLLFTVYRRRAYAVTAAPDAWAPESEEMPIIDDLFNLALPVIEMTKPAADISFAGIEAIKAREGLRLTTYADSAGHMTIGYGHKLRAGEAFPAGISVALADALLRSDLQEAVTAVNALVTVPLTQNQFDALVSFVFNVGVTAFRNSTLLKMLNAGDSRAAAEQFGRWRYVTVDGAKVESGGLVSRRNDEAAQFLS